MHLLRCPSPASRLCPQVEPGCIFLSVAKSSRVFVSMLHVPLRHCVMSFRLGRKPIQARHEQFAGSTSIEDSFSGIRYVVRAGPLGNWLLDLPNVLCLTILAGIRHISFYCRSDITQRAGNASSNSNSNSQRLFAFNKQVHSGNKRLDQQFHGSYRLSDSEISL